MKMFALEEKCLDDNPGIRSVCIPWSNQLFQTNHTCSISGWGRTAGQFPVLNSSMLHTLALVSGICADTRLLRVFVQNIWSALNFFMTVLTAGRGSQYLLWANVSLISDCEKYYGDRFRPGMMCAGWCVPVYQKGSYLYYI